MIDWQGFLNLNKPAGLTSHDCVARVRRLLKTKRVGHGGTLDPAATGVLPIAIGKATRLLQYLRTDKAYRAVIRLGITTTTDDLEGDILSQQPSGELTLEAIKTALPQFVGKLQQIPPMYSAIQVQGQRLYNLARAGETIEVQPRPVEVFQIEVLDWRSGEFPELEVAIACGPGTYIRSIARDLGQVLGVGGTLAHLIRTASCGLALEDSLDLEQLEAQVQAGTFTPIAPLQGVAHLPELAVEAAIARRWCQGQRIQLEDAEVPEWVRVMQADRFLGIGQVVQAEDGLRLVPQMVFEPM